MSQKVTDPVTFTESATSLQKVSGSDTFQIIPPKLHQNSTILFIENQLLLFMTLDKITRIKITFPEIFIIEKPKPRKKKKVVKK